MRRRVARGQRRSDHRAGAIAVERGRQPDAGPRAEHSPGRSAAEPSGHEHRHGAQQRTDCRAHKRTRPEENDFAAHPEAHAHGSDSLRGVR